MHKAALFVPFLFAALAGCEPMDNHGPRQPGPPPPPVQAEIVFDSRIQPYVYGADRRDNDHYVVRYDRRHVREQDLLGGFGPQCGPGRHAYRGSDPISHQPGHDHNNRPIQLDVMTIECR